ncbi:MAG: Flp pilus assembly protein CpaB [Clostridia bacterium]|nr:Flp pilus assembly protein CpaB [Clostridiales bacterium]HZX47284.1 Flp pilus assembly protein CpaB [Clostridia bacterium]
MNKKIIVLAILLTIITSLAVFLYLENYKKSIDYREYAQVVVASRTIPNRSKITRDMLEVVTKDKAYVHPNACRDIESVAGSIATTRIAKGDDVLKDYIAAPGDIEKGLAFVVPDDMRAITIPVNEVSALNYMIRPGDMVDVIVTISLQEESPDGKTKSYNQSNYVLQKVFVLATNSNLGYDNGFVNQESGTSGKNTVTLAVYPEHALPLALACDYGTIRLLLRNPADERETSVKPSLLEHFIRKDDTK